MKDFLTNLVTATSRLYTKISSIEETLNTTGIISQQEFDSVDSKLTELSGNYLVQKIADLEVLISNVILDSIQVFIQLESNIYLRFLLFSDGPNSFCIVIKDGDEFTETSDGQSTSTSEYFDGTYIHLNNNSKIKIEILGDSSGSGLVDKVTFNNIDIPSQSYLISFMVPKNVQYILNVEFSQDPLQ